MMKSYLDFELSVQRKDGAYQIRVLRAPTGEASGDFALPFSELEIENFLLRIGRRRGKMRRIDSPEVQAAKMFGERLFRAAFPEEVRDCLRGSLDFASSQEVGLRLRLRLNEVPELADLPWEYLWDPLHKRFLALSSDTPIVRYLDVPERIRPLVVQPPLRILAMFSSPVGFAELDTEREWTQLNKALKHLIQRGLVALDRLERPTLMDLRRRIRQAEYHIFHFVGHGGFASESQEGVLVLEDEAQRARLVSGQDIATLLQDRRTLRLAVLNACEGARATRIDPFAGTAQSLVQGGIPAVVAMQFEISDQAAVTFASEFYQAIAEGLPIDASLAEARLAIFAEGNGLEWGTPVLYLRASDGYIFDVTGARAIEVRNEAKPKAELPFHLTPPEPEQNVSAPSIEKNLHKPPKSRLKPKGSAKPGSGKDASIVRASSVTEPPQSTSFLWKIVALALTVAIIGLGIWISRTKDQGSSVFKDTGAQMTQPTAADVATGDVSGTITYTGPFTYLGLSADTEIDMNADPVCSGLHKKPVDANEIESKDGNLGDVFVYVKSGLTRTSLVPAEAKTLDQQGCLYRPKVFGIQVGQKLTIKNSDPTLHFIHAVSKANTEFSQGQPFQNMSFDKTFDKPEVLLHFKCDVHPWMSAYVGVVDNPFYAVSDESGAFTIHNLPPGKYTIAAVHPMLGEKTMDVEVAATQTAKADFDFTTK
jgi:plastocyanin